jgi:hypothetical protein
LNYFGGGGTLQLTVALFPEKSVAVTSAAPLSVMCEAMTPAPGLTLGVPPGACTNLILVPLP